ncbi:MAG: N-acetyl sugar amidotransferase [Bacteroidia bacterium]|nr:N-acetyl sugar amidotransferase [Bacteroidia bacterium]
MNSTEYKQCVKCVMDTTTTLIKFDEEGICNFCHDYDKLASKTVNRPKEERYKDFELSIHEIKKWGVGKKYDCILGLSGGLDSSYMALIAKEYGLRPLLVHFDNGWNSEVAIKNIENIVNKTGFDLYTYVINWEEFKDLQIAYFKASVIDIEVPTDQLIFASLYKIAYERNIKYILSGNNIRTEAILPADWCFPNKLDYTNLYNIHQKYGKSKLENFPKLGIIQRNSYYLSGIRQVAFFDKYDFNVNDVKSKLVKEFNYQTYPCKHYESVFTRFYQGYILPKKFNVDKRKAHLSSMICSMQISRSEALQELKNPPYPESEQMEDKAYVLKKWEMSEKEFEDIMHLKPVDHKVFGFDKPINQTDFIYKLYMFYLYKIAFPFGIKKRIL